MAEDYSKYSNEELQKMWDEGSDPWLATQDKPVPVIKPRTPVDNTQGMSGVNLFRAGMGQAIAQPYYGVKDALNSFFPGSPAELSRYNEEKAERDRIDKALLSNPSAEAGAFAGEVIPTLAMPARLPAQVGGAAILGAMKPSAGPVGGAGATVVDRGMQAGVDAGLNYGAAKVIGGIGKGAGAVAKRWENPEAMRLNEAAGRLGVNRTIADLDPAAPISGFERSLPSYARTVDEQVNAFGNAAREVKDIASKSGKSFETRTLEGEKLREGVADAGTEMRKMAEKMWTNLDDYIVQNGLAPVKLAQSSPQVTNLATKYTPVKKGVAQFDRNPMYQRLADYDQQAADIFKSVGGGTADLSFSDLHRLRSAVGRTLGRLEKEVSVPGASVDVRRLKNEVKTLYGTLAGDVETWGAKTKNQEAKKMFDEANNTWRDVVVPGYINNRLVSRASKGVYGNNPRGYSESSQLFSDIKNNPESAQLLKPFASQSVQDMIDTLTTMPHLSGALISRQPHPQSTGTGVVTNAAGMLIGSPLQLMKGALMQGFPTHGLSGTNVGKSFHFAKDLLEESVPVRGPLTNVGSYTEALKGINPAGRAAYGAAQYPIQGASDFFAHQRFGDR